MSPNPNPKQESINRQTYIPEHVKVEMQKQMERNLPAHLKQYSGAYMQQQVVDPSMRPNPNSNRTMQNAAHVAKYGPVTHLDREEHYVQYQGDRPEQVSEDTGENAAPSNFSPEQAYDFVDNPIGPTKRSIIPAIGSSLPVKIALGIGALLVLLILFVIAKNLIGGSSALPAFVGIAQDQQELIHLVNTANNEQELSVPNQNFVATAQLSLASSQADLISYLSKNGEKVSPKQLNLKVSKSTDAQLAAAAAAATYNDTFKEVLKSKLSAYTRDLQSTYQETTGEKGRALLSNQYDQAKLLLIQLEDTKS